MTTMVACLVAAISTGAFVILWFRVVRRELRIKKNMVQSAELQLIACRQKHAKAEQEEQDVQDVQEVISRSEDIYHQSVILYNKALQKPQNHVAGFLMGFRQMREDDVL